MKLIPSLATVACVFAQVSRLCGGIEDAPEALGDKPADYVITSWHIQDGLPSDRVRAVVQTHDGYLWVATFNGLARFDGVSFQRYNDANTPELRNSLVNCLFEDSAGRLWIGSDTGEIAWRDAAGFHAMAMPANWRNAPVDRFVQAADSGMYALNRDGQILRFSDGQSQGVIRNFQGSHYSDLTVDHEGQVWALRLGGILMRIQQENQIADGPPPTAGTHRNMAAARHGGIWVRDDNRLRRWEQGRWVEDRGQHSWKTERSVSLYESQEGVVWVATVDDGAFVVAQDGSARHLSRVNGLGHDLVSSITGDGEGNIWIGTDGGGLKMLRQRALFMVNPPDHWQNRAVLSVAPARNGGLWVGTEGAGVYKLANGQVSRIRGPSTPAASDVRTVLEDHSGRFWAGTQGAGLLTWDVDSLIKAHTSVAIPPLFYALYEDDAGLIWMGTQNGLIRFQQDSWSRLGTNLYRCEVRCITQTPDGALWIGMRGGGVARYQHGQFTQFLRPQGLAYEYIWCLSADADGTVWIGTPGAGLIRWRDGAFATFTTRDGLPSDFICNIQSGSPGQLWIGSYAGILEVDKAQLESHHRNKNEPLNCFVLDRSDGLASLEIAGGNQPTACKTADGRLWFATSAGLACLDPTRIRRNLLPPPVRIEEVLVDGKPVPFQSPADRTMPNRIVAPPGGGSIEFRYTALSFSAPQRCRFRYRLEKMDAAWVEAGSRRSAYYSRLPPRQYSFRVIACNNDGLWDQNGAVISFTVLPFFWKNWWFAPLCWSAGLLLAGAAALTVMRQRHHRRLEALHQAQLVERERIRIARDLHDDLGSGLTDVSMTSALARDPSLSIDEARQYFQEISLRSTEMVSALDEIVWAVNPKNDDLQSLTTYFSQFAERFLRAAPMSCRFQIPVQLPATPLNAEQRHNLFLAFKEALQNAVKHSNAKSLRLSVAVDGPTLELVLEDNGTGFVEGAPQPGADGLRNMRERLGELGGRCEISSAPGRGTRVLFVLPLHSFPSTSL